MPYFPEKLNTGINIKMIITNIVMFFFRKQFTKKCHEEDCSPKQNGGLWGKLNRVQQSRGWAHYEIHKPEPFILLFRRALGTDANTGNPPIGWRDPGY